MFKYPFNYYGWSDFKYKFFKKPFYNLKLIKKANFPFVEWDIYDSVIELTFAQFVLFYEKYKNNFEKNNLWEILPKNKNSEEYKKTYEYIQKTEKENMEIRHIYRYITEARSYNKKLIDEMYSDIHKNCKYEFKRIDDTDLYEHFTLKDFGYEIKWKFNHFGMAQLTQKKEVKKFNHSIMNLEQECIDKDSEYAKKIIDLRHRLVD